MSGDVFRLVQKLKKRAALLLAHVAVLSVRRAGGLGGRFLGFGPVLNSIIGVNSGGFSADARSTQRGSDRTTTNANASPPLLPPPSMSIHSRSPGPGPFVRPSVRRTVRRTRDDKSIFFAFEKNDASDWKWRTHVSEPEEYGTRMHAFIHSLSSALLSLQMIYPQRKRILNLT